MFTIIRGGEVYTPEPLGKNDVLLAGGKIVRVGGEIDRKKLEATGLGCEVVDAEGCVVLPGFIDPHQHILGAGGEAGPASRMPEIAVEDILRAGMTTDSFIRARSRSPRSARISPEGWRGRRT